MMLIKDKHGYGSYGKKGTDEDLKYVSKSKEDILNEWNSRIAEDRAKKRP